MKLLLFFVFSTACLATYIRIINKGNNVNVFQERKFVEGEWVFSDKNMNTLTLYISNYKRDSLDLNYILTSRKYVSGDLENILGKISKKDLLSERSFLTKIAYSERLSDSITVKLRYRREDNRIYWNVVDTSKQLFILYKAVLKKRK